MAKRSKKRCEELPILHPHAAGIDVGASELFVAVSPDRDPQPVRSFPTFTRDLNALAETEPVVNKRKRPSPLRRFGSYWHLCRSLPAR